MTEDGHWLVTFRYNGRLDGRAERKAIHRGLASECWAVVVKLESEAVRHNGAIYWRGYSVDWKEEADAVHE